MQMRGPSAILINITHMANKVTGLQLLARLQPAERLMRHMPPECDKWRAVFRVMLELDETTIPKRLMLDFNT